MVGSDIYKKGSHNIDNENFVTAMCLALEGEHRVEYLNRFNRKGARGSQAAGGLAGYMNNTIPKHFMTENCPTKSRTLWKKNDMVDYIVAYMEVIETQPLWAENFYPLPPVNSPMHFEPTTSFIIPRAPIAPLTDTAPTYQYMQRIFEAQVDIDNHPDADIALLEDGLILALQQMELDDHHAVPPPVIPQDMPDLQDLVRPDNDNATLDELLFYYAGLLKIGGTRWICAKVRHRIQTDSRQDISLKMKERIRHDPVLAELWRTLLLAGVRKERLSKESESYLNWYAQYGFRPTDQGNRFAGLYMWIGPQQESYGGQSVNIKQRWQGHWGGTGGGRVQREALVNQGQAGVMMKVEQGVERSIAESILNLALGLNSEMSNQKVHLRTQLQDHLYLSAKSLNDNVGWETLCRDVMAVANRHLLRRGQSLIPARFPTYFPPRFIYPNDNREDRMNWRRAALEHGINPTGWGDAVFCRDPVENGSLMITRRRQRLEGSYDYLDFQGFSTIFRVTCKFLPEISGALVLNEAIRVVTKQTAHTALIPNHLDKLKAHLSLEYAIPTDQANPMAFIRREWPNVKFHLHLINPLVGKSFAPDDWQGLLAFRDRVFEQHGQVEVEIHAGLETRWTIWERQEMVELVVPAHLVEIEHAARILSYTERP